MTNQEKILSLANELAELWVAEFGFNPLHNSHMCIDINVWNRNRGYIRPANREETDEIEVESMHRTSDGGRTWHKVSGLGTIALPFQNEEYSL